MQLLTVFSVNNFDRSEMYFPLFVLVSAYFVSVFPLSLDLFIHVAFFSEFLMENIKEFVSHFFHSKSKCILGKRCVHVIHRSTWKRSSNQLGSDKTVQYFHRGRGMKANIHETD